MKTRRLNQSKPHTLNSVATTRIFASMVTGAVWGGAWALCVESYQNEASFSFLGNTISPLQALVIGIVTAACALATLAFVFHPRRSFWQPLLAALIVAFLAAMSFYAALAVLVTVLPNIAPSTAEEFFLPLGWSIDNAALFLALWYVGRVRPPCSHNNCQAIFKRASVGRLLFLLLIGGLEFFFFAARSIVSIGVMLTIIPAVVWTGLAVLPEINREGA